MIEAPPNQMLAFSQRMRVAGMVGVLMVPNVEQMAKVNHFENFLVAVAGAAQDEIAGEIDGHDDIHCGWFNAYCTDGPRVNHGRWTQMRRASESPFNRALIRVVYDELRKL